MEHTDVGDYRHAHEPAPTFVSMAAPLNAKGQLTAPGGQILHIDSSGHVLNEKNERCDLYGRPTRPRGARANRSSKNRGWNRRWIATPVQPPPTVDELEGHPQAQGEGQPQALGAGSSSSTDCWTVDVWSAYSAHTKK